MKEDGDVGEYCDSESNCHCGGKQQERADTDELQPTLRNTLA